MFYEHLLFIVDLQYIDLCKKTSGVKEKKNNAGSGTFKLVMKAQCKELFS